MLVSQQSSPAKLAQTDFYRTVYTTLYDLIETVAGVIEPGEERLVGDIVNQLLNDHCARFGCGGKKINPKAMANRFNTSPCRRAS